MSVRIKTNVNYKKILKERGLGSDNRARLFLANEVARLSDPYVPMRTGALKNTRIVASDGRDITYPQNYADVRYRAARGSRKPPRYNGAPMRGPEWDKRMMADRGKDVVRGLAKFVRGKPK